MQFKRTLEIKANYKLMVIDVADILYMENGLRLWRIVRR